MVFSSSNMTVVAKNFVPKLLQPVYANAYEGEWLNIQLGSRVDRKFYKPQQQFYREGGRAIVLGNGRSRQRWSLKRLNQSNKLKRLIHYNILYGCNRAFEEEGELDFLVLRHRFLAKEIPNTLHKITYSTPEIQRVHDDMELIPLHHRLDAGSTAAMLACFHGATSVFLFGFDGQGGNNNNNIYSGTQHYDGDDAVIRDDEWQENLMMVVRAYPGTTFYRVDTQPSSARVLSTLPNYRMIAFNDFVSLADL